MKMTKSLLKIGYFLMPLLILNFPSGKAETRSCGIAKISCVNSTSYVKCTRTFFGTIYDNFNYNCEVGSVCDQDAGCVFSTTTAATSTKPTIQFSTIKSSTSVPNICSRRNIHCINSTTYIYCHYIFYGIYITFGTIQRCPVGTICSHDSYITDCVKSTTLSSTSTTPKGSTTASFTTSSKNFSIVSPTTASTKSSTVGFTTTKLSSSPATTTKSSTTVSATTTSSTSAPTTSSRPPSTTQPATSTTAKQSTTSSTLSSSSSTTVSVTSAQTTSTQSSTSTPKESITSSTTGSTTAGTKSCGSRNINCYTSSTYTNCYSLMGVMVPFGFVQFCPSGTTCDQNSSVANCI